MPNKWKQFTNDVIDNYDMFSSPPPQLNLNKREKVGTTAGFFASLLVIITVLAFATTKFIFLWSKKNPTITTSYESETYSSVNDQLRPDNFKVAFTVRDFATKRVLDDKRDFYFTALLIEGTENDLYKSNTEIGVHKCHPEDEAEFSPPVNVNKKLIKQLFNESSLFCLDSVDLND